MGRFFVILASVIVTGIGLGLVGGFQESDVRILGLAPVCTAPVVPCWLAFGGGTGVLVVGLGGVGVVALTIYGAGVLCLQTAVGSSSRRHRPTAVRKKNVTTHFLHANPVA